MVVDQGNEKPEILYVSRKHVPEGWETAVSISIMDAQGKNHKEIISISDGSERKTIPINKRCWDSFEFFPDGKNVIYEVDGDPDHNNDYHIYRIGTSGENVQILSLEKYHDNQFCAFRPEI